MLPSLLAYIVKSHIILGFTALFASLGAMFTRKGQQYHRVFGLLFLFGMTGVFVTSIPMALIKHNIFLFLIAIFSYYLAFSGWRYAKNRKGVPHWVDTLYSLILLGTSGIMIIYGSYRLLHHDSEAFVLIAFGMIGSVMSVADLKTYATQRAIGKQRIAKHLGAMLGATISTVTAFSVINIPLKPQILLWLGPTVLLSPAIAWWTRKVLRAGSQSPFEK